MKTGLLRGHSAQVKVWLLALQPAVFEVWFSDFASYPPVAASPETQLFAYSLNMWAVGTGTEPHILFLFSRKLNVHVWNQTFLNPGGRD